MFGMRKLSWVNYILALLVLSGCASKSITPPRSEVVKTSLAKGLPVIDPAQEREEFLALEKNSQIKALNLISQRLQNAPSSNPGYKIGAEDEIELNVFDVPELNLVARVNQIGLLPLPLVGAVQAAGLTEEQLKIELAHRLATYVKNPQISVFVKGYGSQKVGVMGAVEKPGYYPLTKESNSLLELLSQAGGISDKAGGYINFIPAEFSGVSGSNEPGARARLALDSQDPNKLANSTIELSIDQILGTSGGIPLEIPVRGGDMLVVPDAGKVMVDGEVEKVGSYELGRQATLLGALASAGGITYSAKIDEVEVLRDISPGKKGRLLVDLQKIATGEEPDIRLKNGDVIRVPSDSGKRMTQDTFEGVTRIINVGVGGTVNLMP